MAIISSKNVQPCIPILTDVLLDAFPFDDCSPLRVHRNKAFPRYTTYICNERLSERCTERTYSLLLEAGCNRSISRQFERHSDFLGASTQRKDRDYRSLNGKEEKRQRGGGNLKNRGRRRRGGQTKRNGGCV